jgi:hypothetical protein
MILIGKEHKNIIPASFNFDPDVRGLYVTVVTICGQILNLTLEQVFQVSLLLRADSDEEEFLWIKNGGEVHTH